MSSQFTKKQMVLLSNLKISFQLFKKLIVSAKNTSGCSINVQCELFSISIIFEFDIFSLMSLEPKTTGGKSSSL